MSGEACFCEIGMDTFTDMDFEYTMHFKGKHIGERDKIHW